MTSCKRQGFKGNTECGVAHLRLALMPLPRGSKVSAIWFSGDPLSISASRYNFGPGEGKNAFGYQGSFT